MGGLSRHLPQASERAELAGLLALLYISGLEALREAHGLSDLGAALTFAAEEIATELRQTDQLGYLDGSDFALALAVAETEGAAVTIDRISANMSATPLL